MSVSTHNKPEVTIRFAKFSEVYACADVLARSFRDDVLFGRYIHPYRHQYPRDMTLFFYRMMLSEYFDWSMVFLVATKKDSNGKEAVVGLAQWHRYGGTARKFGWRLASWDPRRLLSPFFALYSTLASYLHPNRAIDPSKRTLLSDSSPHTDHLWNPPIRQDRWYLHFLGVDPAHHSQGIGRKLVAWGIEQARREDVGASVIAAYNKDTFYQNCGFQRCIGWAGMGTGNPLACIKGGRVWWVREGDVADEEDRKVHRFWMEREPWVVDIDRSGGGARSSGESSEDTTVQDVPVTKGTVVLNTENDDGHINDNNMDAKLAWVLKVDEVRGGGDGDGAGLA